jgi:hypothetical protein
MNAASKTRNTHPRHELLVVVSCSEERRKIKSVLQQSAQKILGPVKDGVSVLL